VPVYAQCGPGGGCDLLDSYRTDLTGLTEDEAQALFMLSVPSPLADLGVSQELKAALLKLSASLPAGQRRDAERVRQRVHLDAAGWFQPEEPVPHLPRIQAALWEDRKLWIKYRRKDGTQRERIVDPYGLVAKASVWYLVAAVEDQMRVYRVSRVREAELVQERFSRSDDFDLVAFWTAWCEEFEHSRPVYPMTVRVAPRGVPLLPVMFGEGVRSLIDGAGPPDDAGWITLSLNCESLGAARTKMLGLGTMAEVLAPLALRESLRAWAADIVAFYAE
jgi:predicted DNA-binding transcriptional regulator YafY